MKSKIKIILIIIILMITAIISNIGQLLLSNEQFRKENKTNLKQ